MIKKGDVNMILDILLWPFLMVYKVEKLFFNGLCSVFSALNKPIGGSKKISDDAKPLDFESSDTVRHKKKKRFNYVVKDISGKSVSGYLDAYSQIDVHSFLLSQGYEVYSITEDKFSSRLGLAQLGSLRKMRAKDLIFFLTQLSTYIKAGIPLVESVKILSRQTKNKNEKRVYQKIVYELNSGVNFSEALVRQDKVFPKLLINMIKTAEMTGQLTDTLDDMAEYYKTIESNRKQVVSAMTYPSVIFVIAIAVVTFMILYVVPQFVGIYAQAGADLPTITKFLINFREFVDKNIITIFLSLVAIIVIIIVLYKNVTGIRYGIQWLLMHIPVIKSVIMYNEVVMFTKTFASLINHDVFITDSMEILGRVTNNEIYKMLLRDALSNLASGKNMSLAFKGHWAFPSTAYEMLVTGERTGRMGEMMEKVSAFYQEEQKTLVTQLKSLIEPIMIVFLALIVGVIVLSIVIPMFDMYTQIGA